METQWKFYCVFVIVTLSLNNECYNHEFQSPPCTIRIEDRYSYESDVCALYRKLKFDERRWLDRREGWRGMERPTRHDLIIPRAIVDDEQQRVDIFFDICKKWRSVIHKWILKSCTKQVNNINCLWKVFFFLLMSMKKYIFLNIERVFQNNGETQNTFVISIIIKMTRIVNCVVNHTIDMYLIIISIIIHVTDSVYNVEFYMGKKA